MIKRTPTADRLLDDYFRADNQYPRNALLGDSPEHTLGSMADLTREELDAKLAAIEARSDAKFERMLGEMRTANAEVVARIDVASAKAVDKWTAFALVIGAVALIFAMLAYGGDLFGLGIDAKAVASAAATEALQNAKR